MQTRRVLFSFISFFLFLLGFCGKKQVHGFTFAQETRKNLFVSFLLHVVRTQHFCKAYHARLSGKLVTFVSTWKGESRPQICQNMSFSKGQRNVNWRLAASNKINDVVLKSKHGREPPLHVQQFWNILLGLSRETQYWVRPHLQAEFMALKIKLLSFSAKIPIFVNFPGSKCALGVPHPKNILSREIGALENLQWSKKSVRRQHRRPSKASRY